MTKRKEVQAGIESPLTVGKAVLIRTVTNYYTGLVVGLVPEGVLLREAAWIPDTGGFSVAVGEGKLNEVEPYPDDVTVLVHTGAAVDSSEWKWELPRSRR